MAVEPSFFVRFGLFEKGWTGFEFQVFGSKRGGRIKFHQHLLGVRKKNNCKVTMVHTVRKAVKMTRYCSRLSLMIHGFKWVDLGESLFCLTIRWVENKGELRRKELDCKHHPRRIKRGD